MFSKNILLAAVILLFGLINLSISTSTQKRWISNDNKIRKMSRMLLQCPGLDTFNNTLYGWCINNQPIYDSGLRRAIITSDSSLHMTFMNENDRISCGEIKACGCTSTKQECNDLVYNFVFNFTYFEENELYCSENGSPRRESTVAGFEARICDCYHGYYGEFCEADSKSRHWMLIYFWFIIGTMLAFLLLALLRQKYQTRYRPPNNKYRFVDILNNDNNNELQ